MSLIKIIAATGVMYSDILNFNVVHNGAICGPAEALTTIANQLYASKKSVQRGIRL